MAESAAARPVSIGLVLGDLHSPELVRAAEDFHHVLAERDARAAASRAPARRSREADRAQRRAVEARRQRYYEERLFRELAAWAYSAPRLQRATVNTWAEHVAVQAERLAVRDGVDGTLPPATIRKTAASIAAYTHGRPRYTHDSASKALAGRRSGAARRRGGPLEHDRAPWLGLGISRATWYRRRKERESETELSSLIPKFNNRILKKEDSSVSRPDQARCLWIAGAEATKDRGPDLATKVASRSWRSPPPGDRERVEVGLRPKRPVRQLKKSAT